LLDVAADYFEEVPWQYEMHPAEPLLRSEYQGEHGRWTLFVKSLDERNQLVVYSILPVQVPADRLPLANEFLSRANFGLTIGSFEIDPDDREVRYKTSIDVTGGVLTPSMVGQLVQSNVTTTDAYLGVFIEVLYGDLSIDTALAEVEN
jgi:hypothetical protein